MKLLSGLRINTATVSGYRIQERMEQITIMNLISTRLYRIEGQRLIGLDSILHPNRVVSVRRLYEETRIVLRP